MLIIKDMKRYCQVYELCYKLGILDNFLEKINYLSTYAWESGKNHDNEYTKCELYNDFEPYDFNFNMLVKKDNIYTHWFNGGLILHGDLNNPTSKKYWGIHT